MDASRSEFSRGARIVETGTVVIAPIFERAQQRAPRRRDVLFHARRSRLSDVRDAGRAHRHPDLLRPPLPRRRALLDLGGAEIVFVPTATSRMARYLWDLELRAHAVANIYYVCGVNKVGVDVGGSTRDHHGASLIASPRGEILAQASDTADDLVVADLDLSALPGLRELWGYYRDRRPDMYGPVVDAPAGALHPHVDSLAVTRASCPGPRCRRRAPCRR